MKGKQLLTIVLALGLLLTLAVGLSTAQGPEPTEPITAQAALGTAFTYQGRLTDGGSPANGDYDFRFRLYDAASGGTQVGSTVTVGDQTVSDGLFTVQLDFGSGAFNGDARYLEIGVRPGSSTGAYTLLMPRQALTPAPYALALPGLWTQQNATSPNLIGGYSSNSVTAGAYGATIGGGGESGYTNRVTDNYGTVGGGVGNRAGDNAGTTDSASYATVGGGGYNTASGSLATVGGGVGNQASSSRATVGGGQSNEASGWAATVGGGFDSEASDDYATVGGGEGNEASGSHATVAGGNDNTASDDYATVGGGYGNTASGRFATVAGGGGNDASGSHATVGGGGGGNDASGDYATVPGGYDNTAQGSYSFAAGRRAKANYNGSFVLADSTDADFTSARENSLRVRFNGGATFVVNDGYWVRFWSSGGRLIEASNGAHLTTGGVWTNASDRDAKENFAPVDGQEVLARLAEVPITTWSYKAEDPSVRRMGPTAQDFYAAFGLGGDERHISTVDADGVALAAIQELYRLYQAQKAEDAALRQQVSDLEARLAALEQMVSGGPQAGGGER